MRFKAAPRWINGTIAVVLFALATPLVIFLLLAEPLTVILGTLLIVVLVLGVTGLFLPEAYVLENGELIVLGRLGGRLHFRLLSAEVSAVPRFVGRLGASPFFGFVGWGWTADRRCVVMLASDPERGIQLQTTGRPVVISPENTAAFRVGLELMMSQRPHVTPPRATPPRPAPPTRHAPPPYAPPPHAA